MKQKIRKIVTAALLSMAVLGMSVPTLSASAAMGSVNDCNHNNKTELSSTDPIYTNVSPQGHWVQYSITYLCDDCGYRGTDTIKKEEPHRQESPGSLFCVCHYYLH
ncbi:MAG: hypothetical protein J1E01_06785 [Acetatifactor sp.]|nr:hypothetical protein [Acetatifactor sp.]